MANPTGKGGFKPGQSGNPSGRSPLVKNIQELARQHCPQAVEALVAALANPRERVSAAVAILDRGYGKPPQFNTGDNAAFRRAIEMSDDELASIASSRSNGADPAPLDKTQLN